MKFYIRSGSEVLLPLGSYEEGTWGYYFGAEVLENKTLHQLASEDLEVIILTANNSYNMISKGLKANKELLEYYEKKNQPDEIARLRQAFNQSTEDIINIISASGFYNSLKNLINETELDNTILAWIDKEEDW